MLASKYRHTLFYGDSFHCPSQILNSFFFFFLNKLQVCGKSIGAIFPTAFAHFLALCRISSLSMMLIWVMVICDQRSLI